MVCRLSLIRGCLDSGSTHWFDIDFHISLLVRDTQVSSSDALSVVVQLQHLAHSFSHSAFPVLLSVGLNAGCYTFLMDKGKEEVILFSGSIRHCWKLKWCFYPQADSIAATCV